MYLYNFLDIIPNEFPTYIHHVHHVKKTKISNWAAQKLMGHGNFL